MKTMTSFLLILPMILAVGSAGAATGEPVDLLTHPSLLELTKEQRPLQRFETAALATYFMGDYDKAVPMFEVLAEKFPNNSGSWIFLAMSYNRLDEPREAYMAADIAITLEPYNEAFYIERGIAAYLLGQDRQAAQDLIRFLKAFDRVPRAYYYLGLVAARQGNIDLARRSLNNAQALDPGLTVPVLYQLGLLDIGTGRFDRGRSSLALVSEVFEGSGTETEKILAQQIIGLQGLGNVSEVLQAVQQSDATIAAKYTPQPLSATR